MPPPSHLVRYKLEMPDGSMQNGVFPDLKTEQPRLFYHRHFMLTEKLMQFFDPEQPGANDPPQAPPIGNANGNCLTPLPNPTPATCSKLPAQARDARVRAA